MSKNKPGWQLWEQISLRAKLTSFSVAIIGLLLVASSVSTTMLLKSYLQRNTDAMLRSATAALSHEDPNTFEVRLASGKLRLPNLPSDYYIAFLDAKGTVTLSAVSVATSKQDLPDLSNFTRKFVESIGDNPVEVASTNASNHTTKTWRILAAALSDSKTNSIAIGLPTSSDDAMLDQYRNIGAGVSLVLLLLTGLAIWFTITSALRPLKEVERTADAVADGDISQRLLERRGRTEISRLNRSLNTMLNSIDTAMTLRNNTLSQMRRFVADASHELRTPLVSVRGYAELYRMGALQQPEQVAEAMNRIESEAIRMGELVEALLALARLDDSNQKAMTQVELISLARSAAKDASVSDHGREIVLLDQLGVPLMPGAELKIEADANQLRQVLTNLLANAIRFSPEGAKVELVIGEQRGAQKGTVAVEVRDHGVGVPEELREKIFERFFRADNSRNRETGGSGLGLAIAKSIIDRHGGSIEATETQGGGATFRIVLPIAQA